jgi:hypothetical protein
VFQRLSSGVQSLQILATDQDSSEAWPGQAPPPSVGFSSLLTSLAVLTRLRSLEVAYGVIADIQGDGPGTFPAALRDVTALEELTLHVNHVRGGVGIILRSLEQHPLSALTLIDNTCLEVLAYGQLKPFLALTRLELQGGHAGVDAHLLSILPALRQLSVSDLGVTDAAVQNCMSSFPFLSQLQRLELVEGMQHSAAFINALSKLPRPELLTHLRLSVEVGKDVAASCLAQLSRLSSLHVLELSFGSDLEPWPQVPLEGLASGLQSLCIKQGQIGRVGAASCDDTLSRLVMQQCQCIANEGCAPHIHVQTCGAQVWRWLECRCMPGHVACSANRSAKRRLACAVKLRSTSDTSTHSTGW